MVPRINISGYIVKQQMYYIVLSFLCGLYPPWKWSKSFWCLSLWLQWPCKIKYFEKLVIDPKSDLKFIAVSFCLTSSSLLSLFSDKWELPLKLNDP